VVGVGALLGISAVALAMVLTPGPNMIYLVSRSITQGRRAGLISLLGVAAGFGVYLIAATVGLTAVFTLVPVLYTVIKLAGAAYLLWLAFNAVRPGGVSAFAPRELPVDGPGRLFTMGLVTNLLNPKIAILYVSLLPQFVDASRGPVAVQSLVLGLTQIVIALTVNALIVLTAGTIAEFLGRRPAWLRAQRWVMGGALGALAVNIIIGTARDSAPTPS
jgi:threonine/homoserine/homoserine lactone efflux protein